MTNEADLEASLRQHQLLRRRLPNAWNPFFARFGSLRPVQLASIEPILSRRNVLITAPTAGGKTEAVAAPFCELIVSQRWTGLSVMLVTPTRALVNDLYYRLERPCLEMRVRLARKTADHPLAQSENIQFLVTTPESLESLLTFQRERLSPLQAIIIDEIHLLDGTARGDQLRILLQRLNAYILHQRGSPLPLLQRVAMSATVPDPRRLADAYLSGQSEVISVAGQREIDSHIIVADGSPEDRVRAAVIAAERFQPVEKVLAFVNSRRLVDETTPEFRWGAFERYSVFGHHGNLSKQRREETESRFHDEKRAICVATMTLEVGIDIGDIDLVICMDPPFSLSSFLQRIGRGCRRLAGRTRVLCVARDRGGELLFEAMVHQARLGLPIGPLRPFRRSVLVQQSLAYLKQVDGNRRTKDQFLNVFSSDVKPAIDESNIRSLLDDLVRQDVLDVRGSVFQPASRGWEIIQSTQIYSNMDPTPPEVDVVDADTGALIAKVAGVGENNFKLAGEAWSIVSNGQNSVRVRSSGASTSSPRYHSQRLAFSPDLGAAVAARLGLQRSQLAVVRAADRMVIMTWLGDLLNELLVVKLEEARAKAKAGRFSITVEAAPPQSLIELLQRAVHSALVDNPLGEMDMNKLADLGPFIHELSPSLQEEAKRDWLDRDYLERWADQLREVNFVSAETELGQDLLALA